MQSKNQQLHNSVSEMQTVEPSDQKIPPKIEESLFFLI